MGKHTNQSKWITVPLDKFLVKGAPTPLTESHVYGLLDSQQSTKVYWNFIYDKITLPEDIWDNYCIAAYTLSGRLDARLYYRNERTGKMVCKTVRDCPDDHIVEDERWAKHLVWWNLVHKHPEERGFELAWLVLAKKRYLAGTQAAVPRQAWDFYLDDPESNMFFSFFLFSLLHTSASPPALTHTKFSCRAALVQPVSICRKAQPREVVSKSCFRSSHLTIRARTKHQTETSQDMFRSARRDSKGPQTATNSDRKCLCVTNGRS